MTVQNLKSKQSGLTLLGFILVLFAYFAMRVYPMYQEYWSLSKVMEDLKKEAAIAQIEPARLNTMLDLRLSGNYITSVGLRDFKFTRKGGYLMSVKYERREKLFYNLFIVGVFEKTVDLGPAK
jgi:Domain of unknown function (DUF4845)